MDARVSLDLLQIAAGTPYKDPAPGLMFSLTSTIPDASKLGKAQVVYQHDSAAVTTALQGFKNRPYLESTSNIGSEWISVEGSFQDDTESNALTDTATDSLSSKSFTKKWRLHPASFVSAIKSALSLLSAKPLSLPPKEVTAGALKTAEPNIGFNLSVLAA